MKDPFYAGNKIFQEEAVDIYITSSWFDNHWMWEIADDALKQMLKDEPCCILAFDESVAIKHGIKSQKYFQNEKRRADEISFKLEFLNLRVKQDASALFQYSMLSDCQVCKQPWYPRQTTDVLSNRKNIYDIPKQNGEIRIVSADIAFVAGSKNDNSSFTCIRALPERTRTTTDDGTEIVTSTIYRRIYPYIEAHPGGEIQTTAIRLRQLYEDFSADYIALDVRSAGVAVLDSLQRVLYDEERKREYSPLSCMNNDNLSSRSSSEGNPCIYAISATQALNSTIALDFRQQLAERKIEFLIPFKEAEEEILYSNKDYRNSPDADTQIWYERPFLETQELISETTGLLYEKKEQTGAIVVREQSGARKDRYTSASYGNHLISLLEQDLLNASEDYDYCVFVD